MARLLRTLQAPLRKVAARRLMRQQAKRLAVESEQREAYTARIRAESGAQQRRVYRMASRRLRGQKSSRDLTNRVTYADVRSSLAEEKKRSLGIQPGPEWKSVRQTNREIRESLWGKKKRPRLDDREWRVFRVVALDIDTATPGEIAKKARMPPEQVIGVLSGLKERGLIEPGSLTGTYRPVRLVR